MVDMSESALRSRRDALIERSRSTQSSDERRRIESELNDIQRSLRNRYGYNYKEEPNYLVKAGGLQTKKSFGSQQAEANSLGAPQQVAQSEVSQAAPLNDKRPSANDQTVRQNDIYYRVSKDGSFESVGTTQAEAERRKRIQSGDATAGDVFANPKLKRQGRFVQLTPQNLNTLSTSSVEATNQAITKYDGLSKSDAQQRKAEQTLNLQRSSGDFLTGSVVDARNSNSRISNSTEGNQSDLRTGLLPRFSSGNRYVRSVRAFAGASSVPNNSPDYYKASKDTLKQIPGFGLGVYESGKGALKFGKNLITNPVQTSKDVYAGTVSFIKDPLTALTKTKEDFLYQPGKLAGKIAFDAFATKGATRGIGLVKEATVVSTGKFLPATAVIDSGVLAGKTFPTTPNAAVALKDFRATFEKGKYKVVSAGPSKYPGSGVITEGARGAKNLEDVGVFTTPKGRASAYFLGIGATGAYKLSLNPFRPFIQELRAAPTITEFSVSGIRTYPQSQLASKGFASSNQFLKSEAPSGSAFITKRSTLGQTSEIEAVIPAGSTFKYTDSLIGRPYTFYKGRVVRIRTADVDTIRPSAITDDLIDRPSATSRRSSSSYYRPSDRVVAPSYVSLFSKKSPGSSGKSQISTSSSFKYSGGSSPGGFSSASSYKVSRSSSSFAKSSSFSSGKYSSSFYTGSSSGSSGFRSEPSLFPPIPAVKRLELEKEKKNNSILDSNKSSSSAAYAPDAYSAFLGIKASKKKKLLDKQTFSGFETRGVLK